MSSASAGGDAESRIDRTGGKIMAEKRRRLAARRKAVGLSQEQLAERLSVERSTVGRWESGDTAPQPWIRPKLGRALHVSIEQLDELLALEPAQEPDAVTPTSTAASAVDERRTHIEQWNQEQAHTKTPAADVPTVAVRQAIDSLPTDGWNAIPDPPSIATIRVMSESFQAADRRLGGGLLYNLVVRYIKLEIAPSLVDPPRDCSDSELFSAAASVTELAGWMAHDDGSNDNAQRHFNRAYRLAVAAENPVLSANVCASLSHLAIQLGQAEDATRISAAGLVRASQGDGPEQLVGRLYAMHARAAAMQGRAKECLLGLGAAHDALRNCGSRPTGWISGFDEAPLAGESALCFYSLGALVEAENEARKVIELRRIGDRVRSRIFGQLTLANVLLKSGTVDEAAKVGLEICSVARSLDSARVRSGLSGLGKSFGASRAVRSVALFLDNLTQLTEDSVTVSRDKIRWPL